MLLTQNDHGAIAQHFIDAANRIGIADPYFRDPYMIVRENSEPKLIVKESYYCGPCDNEPTPAYIVILTTGIKKYTVFIRAHDYDAVDDVFAPATNYLQDLLSDWNAHPYEVDQFLK